MSLANLESLGPTGAFGFERKNITNMDVDGFKLSVDCGGQKNLRVHGIMIPASWVPFTEDELQHTGKFREMPVTKKVDGFILLDTGAGPIGIDEDVARELGLKPTGKKQELHGIAGRAYLESYMARLVIGVTPLKNGKSLGEGFHMGIPLEAWGLPDIQKSHFDFETKDHTGKPIKVIGVLGRLFLQFVKMEYNGLTGKIEIFIDKSAMYPKED